MQVLWVFRVILTYFFSGLAVVAPVTGLYSVTATFLIERSYGPEGKFAQVGGVRLHYLDLPADDPNAPVIVFIHGASGNLRDPEFAFRARLSGRYRLIFIDRPGHGYSSRGPAEMSAPRAQADVIYALLRTLAIERAVIVGHSWGAAVAAAFAVDHGAATAGLLLLAPATHPWPGGVDWYYSVATTPVVGPIFARTLLVPVGQMLVGASLQDVFGPTPVPAGYFDRAAVPLVFRAAEFIANAEDVVNLKANVIAMSPRYREITAPTIVVTGAADTVVRNDLHAAALVREINGARLIEITDAGHMPQYSDPDTVIAAIDELAGRAWVHGFAQL